MPSISEIKGIGKVRAAAFSQKGIETVDDLLHFFPRDHEDRSHTKDIINCLPGDDVLIKGIVLSPVKENRIRKNMVLYTLTVGDDTGIILMVWYNNRFVKQAFKMGEEFVFFGKINPKSRKKEMINPLYERVGREKFMGKIVPVYPLWGTMTQKIIQSAMSEAIKLKGTLKEYLPEKVISENGLCEINKAIENIHFPKTFDDFFYARERLVFEELLFLQLALMYKKGENEEIKRKPFENVRCAAEFLKLLPFEMTNAQIRTLKEILADFKKSKPMNRLVQGDVGSGKTAVAAACMYVAVKNGYQSAIMAPTEILATQHFETFENFFKGTNIRICLLTGSTKKKKELYEEIKNGGFDIIIGTHAIIQEAVEYKNLGLVIADEQHRFGVSQRAKLTNKGEGVHTLIMTATPIPRTLSFILYGDLDISAIDELPPGRKEVKTYAVGEEMRQRIDAFMEKNIKLGAQCYVVCPLIEETQNGDIKNATDLALRLERKFPQFKIGLVHGKMKPSQKEEIMAAFSAGETDILVSTTVIEVGVNVPGATVMIIENAERFGLSQLHQLRGRVGRGMEQSYCVLYAQSSSEVTKKRMEIMCASNDGFYISEEDLKLRGPGDFFGTRQHGLPELKIANLFKDMKILKKSKAAADKILEEDKYLQKEENRPMAEKIREMFKENIAMN